MVRGQLMRLSACSILAVVALAASVHATAATVQGLVRDADTRRGVAGVAVSNGEEFTRTASDGSFSLDVDPGRHRFVFYVSPSGMKPFGTFYRRGDEVLGTDRGRPVFEVRKAPERALPSFRFAHATDTHIGTRPESSYVSPAALRADLARVAAKESPAFFVLTGDLTDLGLREDIKAYREAIDSVSVPSFSLYAGHDGIAASRFDVDYASTDPYREFLGPLSYAFEWGGWHFLVYPELFFEDEQRDLAQTEKWFWSYLAALPADAKIIVLAHDPSRFHTTEGQYEPTPSASRLKRTHAGVKLVLHGQYHTLRTVSHDGVTVSGTAPLTMGGIDTAPRGYAVVTVEGDEFSIEQRWLGETRVNRRNERSRMHWETRLPRSLHRAKPWVHGSIAVVSLGDHGDPRAIGLVALDLRTGQERWRVQTDSTVKNTVAPGDASTPQVVYALSVAGRLYRIRLADGHVDWSADLPRYPDRWLFARPIVSGETVLVAQYSGTAAFSAESGRLLWQSGEQWENGWSPVYQAPPAGEKFYYQLTTKSLGDYAISAHRIGNGEIVWRQRLDIHPDGQYPALYQLSYPSPLLTSNSLYVSGLGDRLWAFEPVTGLLQWTRGALRKEGPESGPKPAAYYAVREQATGFATTGDRLYATTSNGWIHALDGRTGDSIWDFSAGGSALADVQPYFRDGPNVLTEPLIVENKVLAGGADGILYVLDRHTGALLAKHDFGVAVTAPPVQTNEGILVALLDGRVIHMPLEPGAQ